jgi:hypothetical protein
MPNKLGRRGRDLGGLVLMRISDDPRHSGQRCQLLWRALRVAAGHQDAAIRIRALHAPYRGARIFVGALGDGAGVQHDNFCIARRRRALESPIQKLTLQCRAICLSSAAAKILYVEARHAPILNEWMLGLTLGCVASWIEMRAIEIEED